MAEAVVLAIAGGLLAIAVLSATLKVISWWVERPIPPNLAVDLPIVGLCLGLSLATTLVFGLVPALRFSHPALMSALKDDGGGGGRRTGRIQRLASSLQMGIAVTMLVVAGWVVQGARSLDVIDFGFETQNLFVSAMDLSAEGYTDEEVQVFVQSLLDGVGRSRRWDAARRREAGERCLAPGAWRHHRGAYHPGR